MTATHVIVLTLLVCLSQAQISCDKFDPNGCPRPPCIHQPLNKTNLDFTLWDNVLQRYIQTNGSLFDIQVNIVNYSALKNDSDFLNFGWQLKFANVTNQFNFSEWNAFWINTYNYMAVWLVVNNNCAQDLFGACRPLKSIREIGEQQPSMVVGTVWDLNVFTMVNEKNCTPMSLNDVENGRLRMPSNGLKVDVRLHACIVCASISCPNLRNRAYTVANLDEEMTNNTREFLANPKKGSYMVNNNTVQISPIFNWFSGDFTNNSVINSNFDPAINVTHFLSKFAPTNTSDFLANNPNYNKYQYFQYNWDLNGNVDKLCNAGRPCFPWWALVTLLFGLLVVSIIAACVVRRKRDEYTAINNR